MNTFQNIKYFDKSGLEIPLIKASNIVIRTTTDNDDIIFYGVYEGKTNDNGDYIIEDLQLINKGSILLEKTDSIELSIFVDGQLIDEKCIIRNLNDSHFESFYGIDYASVSINHIANNIDENVKYGISHINGTTIDCIIPKQYDLIYPSIAFTGKLSIDRISTGLVENNSIFIAVENNESFETPIDDDYDLLFVTNENEEEIRFFTIDPLYETVNWTNKVLVDLSPEKVESSDDIIVIDNNNIPQVNIGFVSDKEGIFEQTIYILIKHRITGEEYKIGEIYVTAEAIGEDERYRALFANFGIPDPITYPHLFKDAKPYEDKIDWELINYKSKELFLSYHEIFPFVGTYKALINAVNFLGYNDIYFREWYKKLDTNTSVSYRIDVNNVFNDIDNRSHISMNERLLRKKLNHLTMVYQLNTETGETDEYNIPITKNVYEYSIDEILIKLISLKEWLQKNIIALNCRIIDITAEGILYERVDHNIYGMYMQNIEYEDILDIDAAVVNKTVELIDGSANIDVSIFRNSDFKDMSLDEIDDYIFDDFDNETLEYPIIYNAEVKAYVDTSNAIIGYYGKDDPNNFTDKALWINDGKIYIQTTNVEELTSEIIIINDDNTETHTGMYISENRIGYKEVNFDSNKCPIIQLQSASLRNDNVDWLTNEEFVIKPTNYKGYSYSITNLTNANIRYSNDYIILYPTENAELRYTLDNAYNVPLFKIKGYEIILYNVENKTKKSITESFIDLNKEFILEIRDGKMINRSYDGSNKITCLNFHYDNDVNEQSISATIQYSQSFNYDFDSNNEIADYDLIKGSICSLNVNNIGHYKILVYAYNKNGNVYAYEIPDGCNVIMEKSNISALTHFDKSENNKLFREEDSIGTLIDSSFDVSIMDYYPENQYYTNETPIFRDSYINSYLTYDYKDKSKNASIIYPNISYANDIPKQGDYIQLMNICDSFKLLSPPNELIDDYQNHEFIFQSVRHNAHNYFLADRYDIIETPYSTEGYLLGYDDSGRLIDKTLAANIYGNYYIRGYNIDELRQQLEDPDYFTSTTPSLSLNDRIKIPVRYDASGNPEFGTSGIIETQINYPELCYCNIIFYDRVSNSALEEFDGIITKRSIDNDNDKDGIDKYKIKLNYNQSEIESMTKKFQNYLLTQYRNNNIVTFIQPTGEHNISAVGFAAGSDETLTAMTIENYNQVYNGTSIFRAGDLIKVIYEVKKNKEVKVFMTSGYSEVSYFEESSAEPNVYYKDGIEQPDNDKVIYDENSKEFFLYTPNSSSGRIIKGTIHTRYKDTGDNPIYKGYTTIRVHSFDPTTKTLILDGKYNYKQYFAEYLLGYTATGQIDGDIKTQNEGYYIVRYKDGKNGYKNVKLRKLDDRNTKYKIDQLFTSVKVAHTYQAYVKYKMQVNDSKEQNNGTISISTKQNRLYDYLDGTFSFISKPFDSDNAFDFWMDNMDNKSMIAYNYENNYNVYRHDNPFTMRISNAYKNRPNYKPEIDKNILIYAHSNKIKDLGVYWKVYKQNITNKTRELLFEVTNDKLFLSITQKGIYDIVAYAYDSYGNLIETEYEAFINAV